jgi:DNA-binding MarR family transcriptional regulator
MPSPIKKVAARPKPAREPAERPPLTVSRPELLIDGSDRHFRRLVHGLFGFFARHEAVRAGHAARIGLVGIEYTVLISIRHLAVEDPNVSVNRVAEHLYLSGAFVTTITNKLLKRGLIHKRPDPADRRRVRLEVSAKGNALLAELAPVQRQVNDVEFRCLSRAEFISLLSMVERLIESSDQAIRLQQYLAHHPSPPSAIPRVPEAGGRKVAARRRRGFRHAAQA